MRIYFDTEIEEWVAVSDLSGREYFGLTFADAERRCMDNDEIYIKNHKSDFTSVFTIE
jgi:hypothetical protein